jgi:hypothetical protein
MLKKVAAAMIGDSKWRAITDSRFSGKLTIASGLGAQKEASTQFGADDSVWATVLAGIAPCSGISHSSRLARSGRPRQAAVPKTGCSWSSRSRAAKLDFIWPERYWQPSARARGLRSTGPRCPGEVTEPKERFALPAASNLAHP